MKVVSTTKLKQRASSNVRLADVARVHIAMLTMDCVCPQLSFAAVAGAAFLLSATTRPQDVSLVVVGAIVCLGIGNNLMFRAKRAEKGMGFGFGAASAPPSLPLYGTSASVSMPSSSSDVSLAFRLRRVRSGCHGCDLSCHEPTTCLHSDLLQIMRHVLDDHDSRRIFLFLVVNVGARVALYPIVVSNL